MYQGERRIILIGGIGVGKSSTGNSILCKNSFFVKASLDGVTERCSVGIDSHKTISYKVVDTPGLFCDGKCLGKRAIDIMHSVEMCKNPHAFLIIFSASNRLTHDDSYTIDMLRVMFGETILKHAIVVFTHGKYIISDSEFKKLWTVDKRFADLVHLCGDRVTTIENTKENFDRNNTGRQRIIDMIEKMSESGKRHYNYRYLTIHREVLEEHCNTHYEETNIREELVDIVQRLNQRFDGHIWKSMLFGLRRVVATVAGSIASGLSRLF